MAWGLLSLVACFLILSDSMQLFCGRGPLPVCRESLILRGKELFQSRGRERPIGVIALAVVATQFLEQRTLLGGLDARGDDPQAEASRQGDCRIDDRPVVGAGAYAADERSGQFQRVQGKAFEIVEGRIAGAEVVDGETDVQGAQRLEHGLGFGVLADHDALGDFQLEARRRNRRLGEHPGDGLDEPSVELSRGHVDAHLDGLEPGVWPGLGLGAGALQYPGADRLNRPGLFGQRYELPRRQPAQFRIVPAEQGFDRVDFAAGEADLRLIVNLELAVLESTAEPGLHVEPAGNAGLGLGGVELVVVAAVLLRLVHGHIGALQQLFGRLAVAGEDRDPDARRDVDFAFRKRERSIELRADPVRDRGNARLRLYSFQEDGELVTAEARNAVLVAHAAAYAFGRLAKDLVSVF